MTNNPNNRQKYFFDANNFDGPASNQPEEDLPPPPPIFSLEELGSAKDEAFSAGREKGLEEARASREQYIASLASSIHEQIRAILLAEQMREKKFEEDVLVLCRAMFTRIFPSMAARHSVDEILSVVRGVLADQDQSKVVIDVPVADAEEISAALALLIEAEPGRVEIRGADDLGTGSCRMRWENGGAQRDQAAVVDAIVAALEGGAEGGVGDAPDETAEDGLASDAQTSHNNNSGDADSASSDEDQTRGEGA